MTDGGVEDGAARAIPRYSVAILAMLLLTNIFNFIDRQLPYILAEQIKHELMLSDTQLGILGGAAFAVVYAVLGLPLAHMADRYGSRWVLSGCVFVWSLATSLGGLAANFLQLAATRLGVAVGEAGATPVAYAVISAQFPPERRAVPISIYSLGVPLGTMIGLVLGGWLGSVMSWRHAFMLIAAPGIVLAVCCAIVLRRVPKPVVDADAEQLSLWQVLRFLLAMPMLRHVFCAAALMNTGAYAMISFSPAFYGRTFGMDSAAVGLALGAVHGIGGSTGALLGGWSGQKLAQRDVRWQLWVPMIGLMVAVPFVFGAFLAGSFLVSIFCFAVPKGVNLLFLGPTFSTVLSQVPARMQATASAAVYFCMGLIGMSLGPLIVGMVSDALRPTMGNGSLRYALLLVAVTHSWAAVHFWLASRHLKARAE